METIEKDNAYESASAEHFAQANEVEENKNAEDVTGRYDQTVGLTALGKFKDVSALSKAYSCLQAEFTRRSQKLKELQKQVDNLTAENSNKALSGVEKLRKNAKQRKVEEEKFDNFVLDLEKSQYSDVSTAEEPQKLQITEEKDVTLETQLPLTNAPFQKDNAEDTTFEAERNMDGFAHVFTQNQPEATKDNSVAELPSRENKLSSSDLYEMVKADEGVRLKLIGEYLSSLGKNGTPLLCGGAGTIITPPQKARNIKEAGVMALQMFQK